MVFANSEAFAKIGRHSKKGSSHFVKKSNRSF